VRCRLLLLGDGAGPCVCRGSRGSPRRGGGRRMQAPSRGRDGRRRPPPTGVPSKRDERRRPEASESSPSSRDWPRSTWRRAARRPRASRSRSRESRARATGGLVRHGGTRSLGVRGSAGWHSARSATAPALVAGALLLAAPARVHLSAREPFSGAARARLGVRVRAQVPLLGRVARVRVPAPGRAPVRGRVRVGWVSALSGWAAAAGRPVGRGRRIAFPRPALRSGGAAQLLSGCPWSRPHRSARPRTHACPRERPARTGAGTRCRSRRPCGC
jgi:hypothetical protein